MYKIYTIKSGVPYTPVHKVLLIMRLTIFIMFIMLFRVSGATLAQSISLNEKNVPIKVIITKIQQQSNYDFVYTAQQLKSIGKVSISVKSANIRTVLNLVFKDQPLTYTIDDNTIVLKEKIAATSAVPINFIDVSGNVSTSLGAGLPGATVRLLGTQIRVATDQAGNYKMLRVPDDGKLIFSYIGYRTDTISITGQTTINVVLKEVVSEMGPVSIVSTGLQDLPKERATGSFEVISKVQLLHSTDPNLVRRLEGITTSLDFRNDLRPNNSASPNARQSPLANLTIRGKNTLNDAMTADLNGNYSGQVLVVIDGIASPYSIDKVNPNDVESVTILKDAAAASIWGSRAANGVIVIKTKRGSYNHAPRITFNSNANLTEKVDLFYNKTMSVSDFIDAQATYFESQKRPLADLSITHLYGQEIKSPVAEIINAWKFKGTLTDDEANRQLDVLRNNDIRQDYEKYFLRNAVTQSYSLALDGGSDKFNYRVSGGLDKGLNNTENSDYNRLAIGYSMSIKPLSRLELQGNISYNVQKNNEQAPLNRITGATDATFYPYSRLVDDNGSHLELAKMYRQGFAAAVAEAYGSNFLSYSYVPLDDINEGYNKLKSQNLNLNFSANYKVLHSLSAQFTYNYNTGRNNDNTLYSQNSFYMRNMMNYFTTSPVSVNPMTYDPVPAYNRQLPLGGQYTTLLTNSNNHTLRGQLNFEHAWNEKHEVSAIAGLDVAQSYSIAKTDGFYGYNESTLSSNNKLDYKTMIPIAFAEDFSGYNGEYIPNLSTGFIDNKVRTFSYYTNAAYTYDRRYTLSASLRKDLSSEFGRGTNQNGTPYYSVGAAWNINNESFYNWDLLQSLIFRATYGFNGNVNPSIIARPLITYSIFNGTNNLPYAYTSFGTGISNSQLRPERTGVMNVGLDFVFKKNRLSGNVQYYNKKTTDLVAGGALDPSTGYTNITYNTGNLKGQGVEFTLNSLNLELNKLRWNSNFLFAYNKVKVTKLYATATSQAGAAVNNSSGSYNEGYDLSRLFGYEWAGLDPQTGDPRGYVDGNIVTISNNSQGEENYRAIQNAPIGTLKYFGSAVPVYYGSLRNTFSYGSVAISANLLYKFDYFVRRPTSQVVNYSSLNSGNSLQGIEYNDRWQKPGDEVSTNVPSKVASTNFMNRDNFYYYSAVNVIKGDHIRLQEINLSYTLRVGPQSRIKQPRFYTNISNLGIVWRANDKGIDPEVFDYPLPRTYSLGFSANF
ncbi:SusC/RagA family TonB-linked outer membrane protein [Desertivirga xinjiangensis]|uniref:SusC/RagA family TonB-linked outer membrane protein n=1 Tax=Desertivirga xinjiangensis TaxID=539206 RepID=UPI00210E08A5|nr:SusC/RagA family TonB-linked outer membrane protein [Pedobacter xinjiangensis]